MIIIFLMVKDDSNEDLESYLNADYSYLIEFRIVHETRLFCIVELYFGMQNIS